MQKDKKSKEGQIAKQPELRIFPIMLDTRSKCFPGSAPTLAALATPSPPRLQRAVGWLQLHTTPEYSI